MLFNRYSGVIKIYGDDYSDDVPALSLTLAGGGSFASGQTVNYGLSYIKSGWESDVAKDANVQVTSGYNAITISWTPVTGVSQYALWRWSGAVGRNTTYTNDGSGLAGAVELLTIIGSGSFTDTNVAALQTGLFRHKQWETSGRTLNFTTSAFISSPSAIVLMSGLTQYTTYHSYFLSKNNSGTNLLGPFYFVFHLNNNTAGNISGILIGLTNNAFTAGAVAVPRAVVSGLTAGNWYRFVLYVSGTAQPTSGYMTLQINTQTAYIDDVFWVAQS